MSDERNGKNPVSHHILPTSSNLLGLCFILLSFMKMTRTGIETTIDEFVAVAVVLFLASSIISYMSIRTASNRADRYEKIADVIFISGLGLLSATALIIVFELI